MNNNKSLLITAVLVIFAGAMARLIPHPINFAPIGALAIFGGMTIKEKKYALVLPLGALLLSDLLFELFTKTPGFYGGSQYFVYGAFILVTFLATLVKKTTVMSVFAACVWSGIIFFALSNFGVWASGGYYPKTWAGLTTCFAAAIPFYSNDFFGNMALNTLWSNIFFSGLLFGAYYLVKQSLPVISVRQAA